MTQAHPAIKILDKAFDLDEAKKQLPQKYFDVYRIVFELNSCDSEFIATTKTLLLEVVTDNNHSFLFLSNQNENVVLNVGDSISYDDLSISSIKNNISFENFLRLLKEANIGKPSTYGSVLEKLFSGGSAYLKIEDGNVVHTKLGSEVYQTLRKNKRQIADYQFNIDLEGALDDIEDGLSDPCEVLQDYLKTYIDQEINELSVDFNFSLNSKPQIKDPSDSDSVFELIPEDHYLQGVKIAADDILADRSKKNSNSLYKLKILYEYYEINSLETFSERLRFDVLFRWFVDLKMTDLIPSNNVLTNFLFSDQAISLKNISSKKE